MGHSGNAYWLPFPCAVPMTARTAIAAAIDSQPSRHFRATPLNSSQWASMGHRSAMEASMLSQITQSCAPALPPRSQTVSGAKSQHHQRTQQSLISPQRTERVVVVGHGYQFKVNM